MLAFIIAPALATQYDFQEVTQTYLNRIPYGDFYDAVPDDQPRFFQDGTLNLGNRIGIMHINSAACTEYTKLNSTRREQFTLLEFTEPIDITGDNIVGFAIFDSTYSNTATGTVNAPTHVGPQRLKIQRIGSTWKLYSNSIYVGDFFTSSIDAYYYRVEVRGWCENLLIDNLIIGDSQPDLIASLPRDWALKRDMLTPSLKGVINETGDIMNTDRFDLDWTVDTPGTYTIQLTHLGSGTVYNSTTWTAAYDYTHGLLGNRSYSLSDSLINTSAPYGLYVTRLKDSGGTILDSSYFPYIASGGTITFDRSTYTPTDTATITSTISSGYWDTVTYSYRGYIMDLYGTEYDSWSITSQTQEEDVSLADYDTGDYYAVLEATERSSGDIYVMAFDTASIEEVVNIEGLTVNVQTGALLSGPTIGMQQSSSWHNTTASGGIYNLSDFSSGLNIDIYARKSTFNFTDFTFFPAAAGNYNLTLNFIPDVMGNSTATGEGSIVGIVYEDWSHNPIPGATVRISNATWTGTTNTTNAAGYYEFHELAAGNSYILNSTATGYDQSIDYSRSPIQSIAIVQNIEMSPNYVLGIECRDHDNDALITGQSILVELSDGQSASTTSGRTQFTLGYGAYSVTGSTEDYYVASSAVLMMGDRNITLDFTKQETATGSGVSYPPHQVSFIVKNMWGKPLEGIYVSALGYETTTGSWDWLKTLLGMDLGAAPIHNETMEGYTGRDGAIVFMMIENVKYTMNLTNATQGVSTTYEVYPKSDYYEIWVTTGAAQWWSTGYDAMEQINITVTKARINSTYGFINITYKDALAGTTNVDLYINQSDKTGVDKPDTVVAGSLGIASSDFNKSYKVPADDDSYFVVFGITHSTFGNVVRTFSVMFEKIEVGIGLPSSWMVYISVFLILFTGMFFGAVTSPTIGAVITCFVGWFLWSLGWMADLGAMAPVSLTFATVISVLSVIMFRSRYP